MGEGRRSRRGMWAGSASGRRVIIRYAVLLCVLYSCLPARPRAGHPAPPGQTRIKMPLVGRMASEASQGPGSCSKMPSWRQRASFRYAPLGALFGGSPGHVHRIYSKGAEDVSTWMYTAVFAQAASHRLTSAALGDAGAAGPRTKSGTLPAYAVCAFACRM